jgi:hypothetical protein
LIGSLSDFTEQTRFVFKFPSSTVLKWNLPFVLWKFSWHWHTLEERYPRSMKVPQGQPTIARRFNGGSGHKPEERSQATNLK